MAYDLNENSLRLTIEHCQERIFALTLYMIGGDRDKAYDAAATGFADVLRAAPALGDEKALLVKIARAAIERSREAKAIPFFDDSDLAGLSPARSQPLRIIRKALLGLPFETKTPLVLRDMLRLPYRDISAIMRIPEKDARIRTTQARGLFRKKIEEALRHGG